MTLEYVTYIMMPSNNIKIFLFFYSYIHVDTWKSGRSYTPNTIKTNHCSSRHYSQDTLFIPIFIHWEILFTKTLPLKIPTSFKIFTLHSLFVPHTYIHHSIFTLYISQNIHHSYKHYSLFVPPTIPSYFLSFFPWR